VAVRNITPERALCVRVADDSTAESERRDRPHYKREDIAEMLTEVRSLLLRIMGENHHPDRIVTLPRSMTDRLSRAEREVGEACEQMLDSWDALSPDGQGQ
jgi:hypothetical protein